MRVPDLIDYQDEAYAKRYADVIKRVVAAEARAVPGKSGLAEAAARYLYKLMAYKDEYEVARLHTDPAFVAQLDAMFKHGYTVKYNLAPPTISKKDPVTGHLIKQQFGPWMRSAFGWLKKFKGLRGGALDFFGKTEERRHERQMIEDYIKELDDICAALSPVNHAAAVALASVPDEIRGYGHVKEKSVAEAKTLREQRANAFRNPQASAAAAAAGRSVGGSLMSRREHERTQDHPSGDSAGHAARAARAGHGVRTPDGGHAGGGCAISGSHGGFPDSAGAGRTGLLPHVVRIRHRSALAGLDAEPGPAAMASTHRRRDARRRGDARAERPRDLVRAACRENQVAAAALEDGHRHLDGHFPARTAYLLHDRAGAGPLDSSSAGVDALDGPDHGCDDVGGHADLGPLVQQLALSRRSQDRRSRITHSGEAMNDLNGYDLEDLSVGMNATFAKTITEADIVMFAGASGDNNAVHINEEFAQTTQFKGRIAHGMLTASVISAAIAGRLPGPGTVYMGQNLRFKAPVRPGDTVHATVTVKELFPEKGRVALTTVCTVNGKVVIEGDALVMPTSREIRSTNRVLSVGPTRRNEETSWRQESKRGRAPSAT